DQDHADHPPGSQVPHFPGIRAGALKLCGHNALPLWVTALRFSIDGRPLDERTLTSCARCRVRGGTSRSARESAVPECQDGGAARVWAWNPWINMSASALGNWSSIG